MRVLLSLHDLLDTRSGGGPVATLSLGKALTQLGADVEYYGLDTAFPRIRAYNALHKVRFPWHLAAFLSRYGGSFDIVDVCAGDGWLWNALRRPGAKRRHLLVSRSHGLNHFRDVDLRDAARRGEGRVSWKHQLYDGGFRLWEVEQSFKCADHVFVLNDDEYAYVQDRFGVSRPNISLLPNGIADYFHGIPARPSTESPGSVVVAFIGKWFPNKGIQAVTETVSRLHGTGLVSSFLLLGTGKSERDVLADFPAPVRPMLRVVATYGNEVLPQLLAGCDIFLFPSWREGFGLGLLEAMACGLVPVVTRVGVARSIIDDGQNGFFVPLGDSEAMAAVIARLATNPPLRSRLREKARAVTQRYTWQSVAKHTIDTYESALRRRGECTDPADTRRSAIRGSG